MNGYIFSRMSHIFNTGLLKWGAGFFGLVLLQISVLKHLALVKNNTVIQPDLILILLFFYGIRQSQIGSTLAGFFSGLLLDAFSGGMLGMHAFSKTVAGFLIGYIPRSHKIQTLLHFCLSYFIIGIIHDFVYNFLYTINSDIGIWRLLFVHSLPSTLYSVFIGGIIFYMLKR